VHSSQEKRRAGEAGGVPHPMACEKLRPLLFDYMSRELGESRSALVREHLRHCPACQQELVAIEETLSDLRSSIQHPERTRLSERRRKRLMRLAANPFLNWLDEHHKLVSMLLTLLVLLLILGSLRSITVQTFEPRAVEEGIPIWRYFRSGPLPERVAEAAARQRAAQTNAPPSASVMPLR
jgi:predicted anti-sigma-YlaC factor YlaD